MNLGRQWASIFFEDSFYSLPSYMHKIMFLCRFNGIVYFVSSLLISFPSRRVIFLNSHFFHVIRFKDFTSQGTRLFWSGACLSTTSINKFFQASHITSGFVSEKTLFRGCCSTSSRKWRWLKYIKRHADDSGRTYDLYKLAIAQSNVTTLLKIPPVNTT